FEVELNGLSVGTDYDQLAVGGSVILGGATLDVTLGFVPTLGEEFVIIDNDDSIDLVSGTFAGLSEGGTFTVGGVGFEITAGGGDNNWTTAENWVGDVAPTEGDNLLFADGAARLSNSNDFAEGTDFGTITIAGAGYTLSGSRIDLTGDILATYTSGTSTISVG